MSRLCRKTERLWVRVLRSSDYGRWKEAYSTMLPPQNRWDLKNRDPKELTRRKFADLLGKQTESRVADQHYDLAIVEARTGSMIGRAGIMDVQRGLSQSAYLGYTIFNRYWNQGYGKESVRAVIDIAFRDLKLHRIEAGVEPSNRRSIRLARSLGLRKEGSKKRAVMMREEWVDLVMYSATTEDFGIRWMGQISS